SPWPPGGWRCRLPPRPGRQPRRSRSCACARRPGTPTCSWPGRRTGSGVRCAPSTTPRSGPAAPSHRARGRGGCRRAPGPPLWGVKVLDDEGDGTVSDLLCGVDWVTATRLDQDRSNDIAVANLSVGGRGGDDGHCGDVDGDVLHKAICRSVAAGTTYVA